MTSQNSKDAWQLAELNIAKLIAPLDSPQLESFVAQLDTINSLAEQSPGFVWRWIDEGESNGGFDLDTIVNLSVWQNIDSLFDFTYKTAHSNVMRDRKQWFTPVPEAMMVLWWVAKGREPSPAESRERLALLRKNGPSAQAFTFKHRFDVPS